MVKYSEVKERFDLNKYSGRQYNKNKDLFTWDMVKFVLSCFKQGISLQDSFIVTFRQINVSVV